MEQLAIASRKNGTLATFVSQYLRETLHDPSWAVSWEDSSLETMLFRNAAGEELILERRLPRGKTDFQWFCQKKPRRWPTRALDGLWPLRESPQGHDPTDPRTWGDISCNQAAWPYGICADIPCGCKVVGSGTVLYPYTILFCKNHQSKEDPC